MKYTVYFTDSVEAIGYTPMITQAVINVTPGGSFATAINLRDKHVRATLPSQDVFHYYYIDILPSEVNTLAFALILAKLPGNSDFDLYLLDEDNILYTNPIDGVGVQEEYLDRGMPHAGRFYIVIHSYAGWGTYDLYAGKYYQEASITIPSYVYSVPVGSAGSSDYAYSSWININLSSLSYSEAPKDAYLSVNAIRFVETVNATHMSFARQIRLTSEPAGDPGWGWAITNGGGPSDGERLTPPILLDQTRRYAVRNTWTTRVRVRWCSNLSWTLRSYKMDVTFPACADNFEFF